VLLRLILALASPEFRRSYGEALLHDMRALRADSRNSRAYIARSYLDLFSAVVRERLGMLLRQLMQAIRSFARTPAVTTVMVATLALGIGANVAAFSIANGVLLRPLPFDHPERIVAIYRTTYINAFFCTDCPHSAFSTFAYRDRSHSFDAMAPYAGWAGLFSPGGGRQPQNAGGMVVGAQFFDVLKTRAKLGRLFTLADESPTAARVFVASHQFWVSELHADPQAVGRTLFLDARPYRLVGVLPPEFISPALNRSTERPNLYVVLRHTADLQPGYNAFRLLAREKPGISQAQAQADVMVTQSQLKRAHPDSYSSNGRIDVLRLVPLNDDVFGPMRPLVIILFSAVSAVLLIACLNVANLLLARAVARQRDVMLRVAIGATQRHVIGQVICESTVLTAFSLVAGIAIAHYAVAGYVQLAPPGMHRLDQIVINAPVYLYALGVAIVTTLVTSAVPIFVTMRSSIASSLKRNDRAAHGGSNGVRNTLVVAQIACAFVMIVSCGLLVRSFVSITSSPMGYETGHLIEVRSSRLPPARYPSTQTKLAFYQRFSQRLAAIGGIVSVSYATHLPLDGSDSDGDFRIAGRSLDRPDAHYVFASATYFETLGIRPSTGRTFARHAGTAGPPEAIVDEEFQKHFLKDGALGKDIVRGANDGGGPIVGVVPTVQINGVGEPPVPTMYFLLTKNSPDLAANASMLIRASASLETLRAPIASAWHAMDPTFAIPEITSVREIVEETAAPARASAILLGALAFLALILAVSGTASVVAYNTARRTNEIGLRMALGARSARIRFAMLRGATIITALGITVGLLLAAFTSRALSDQLFEVAPFDPITYVVVAATLALATLIASFVPVYSATRIDPATALRYE
jgi:putative ABC transport system permease protein